MHTHVFWITIIKSCHVDLGARFEGGLVACVILDVLNGGRCHSLVKLKSVGTLRLILTQS